MHVSSLWVGRYPAIAEFTMLPKIIGTPLVRKSKLFLILTHQYYLVIESK